MLQWRRIPLAFLQLLITVSSSSCPQSCVCGESENSGSYLNCSGQKMKMWPEVIPQNLQSMDMSYNSLTVLSDDNNPSPSTVHSVNISHNRLEAVARNWLLQYPGLEVLDLSSNNLKNFDFALPEGIQRLFLKENELRTFELENLLHCKYLKDLYIDQNKISTWKGLSKGHTFVTEVLTATQNEIILVSGDMFSGMKYLKHLYLSHNQITYVEKDAFQENTKLSVLDLSNNSITFIESGTFQHLEDLTYLSLAKNRLVQIPDALPELEWFDISYNLIQVIPENRRTDIFPHEVLLLGGNPFYCDCHLQWLFEFWETRQYLLKYIQVERLKFIPTCTLPKELSKKFWHNLMSEEFMCKKLEIHSKFDEPHSGADISGQDFSAKYVGHDYIKLQWTVALADENTQYRTYRISYHPFGRKDLMQNVDIDTGIGKYTIKGIQESTAYVVCLYTVETDRNPALAGCVEIQTHSKSDDSTLVIYLFWTCVVVISLCIFSHIFDATLYNLFVKKLFEKMNENSKEKNRIKTD